MPAPASAAFLAAGLLLAFPRAALADGLCKITSDTCLQRNFLEAPNCDTIKTSYNNNTLSGDGFFCCWAQGPVMPPPAVGVSAWLQIDDNGVVSNRCLTSGDCPRYYDLTEYHQKCE